MRQSLALHEEALGRLARSLPPPGEDVSQQARSVLIHLVRSINTKVPEAPIIDQDPSTCPNCGVHIQSARSPYCSARCREVAGFIRRFRSGLEDGSIFDEERQVALGQAMWHLLGGGRPLREHLILERTRAQVMKRDEGRCQVCGAAATTIDHTGSG